MTKEGTKKATDKPKAAKKRRTRKGKAVPSLPSRIDVKYKQQEALALRRAGFNFATIAEKVGYASRAGAYKAVMTAIAEIIEPEVKAYRSLEGARLDESQAEIWEVIQAPIFTESIDPRTGEKVKEIDKDMVALKIAATNAFIKISTQRCKIFGLYKNPGPQNQPLFDGAIDVSPSEGDSRGQEVSFTNEKEAIKKMDEMLALAQKAEARMKKGEVIDVEAS